MQVFSLTTFLKVSLLDTGGRISEIQKRLDPTGEGYDFYNSYQRAFRENLKSGDSSKVDLIFDSLSNEVERENNRAVYDKINSKFGSKRSIAEVKHKKQLIFSAEDITISLDPLFSIEQSGVEKIFQVWATKKPNLTQRYAAVGCYLMREAYRNTSLGNAQFFIYDTVHDRTYSEKQINNNTSMIFKADLASISSLIKTL